MARQATADDFEGRRADSLYTLYRRYDFFATRAAIIHARYPAVGKILIAGCGYGYLVDELVKLGRDAWGIDAATYAVNTGKAEMPQIAGRLILADAGNSLDMQAARAAAGLTGNRRFDLIVDEDMLPVMSDAEATGALAQMRANVLNGRIFHIITPGDPVDPSKVAALNWKSIGAWKAIMGAEPILNAETGEVTP
jgi:SAM-dependent methyltransferase